MLAKIRLNKSIQSTIRYHLRKEERKQAECLEAVNFVKDRQQLSQKDIVDHFRRNTSLHESISYNVVHMSLNFHPSDKLSNEDMVKITARHMEAMRMSDQPYLIYRHHDSAQPHLHIVTTNIQHDGEKVDLSKTDYYHAHQLSRDIEKEYRLKVSGEYKKQQHKQAEALTVRLGKNPVMEGMTRVLDKVIPGYKYKSMDEYNAVLSLYHMDAFRGGEGSRLYQRRGLLYRVLDDNGMPAKHFVKASMFGSKPTLARLEKQFQVNREDVHLQKDLKRVKNAIDWPLYESKLTLPALEARLEREGIAMVWMKGNGSNDPKLYYVDHQTRSVSEGRALGPAYDADGLCERCAVKQTQQEELVHKQRHTIRHGL